MGFHKAVIKGLLVPEMGVPIPFLYNPAEISDEKVTEYAEKKPLGYGSPHYHFKYGGPRTMSFDLHFNDNIMKAGTLELYVGTIRDLQYPSRDVGIIKKSPSVITFVFGMLIFRGVIVSTQIKRQRFGSFLNLKEVTMTLTFKEISEGASFLGFSL